MITARTLLPGFREAATRVLEKNATQPATKKAALRACKPAPSASPFAHLAHAGNALARFSRAQRRTPPQPTSLSLAESVLTAAAVVRGRPLAQSATLTSQQATCFRTPLEAAQAVFAAVRAARGE